MIQTYSTTIRRKEMDAVLTCMVDEKIGPGEINSRLIQTTKEFFKCDGCVALRSPAIALKYIFQALNLEQNSKVMISALAPAWQYQALCSLGMIPVVLDVQETNGLISIENIQKAIEEGSRVLIFHETEGILPDYESLSQLGITVIEDISSSAGSSLKIDDDDGNESKIIQAGSFGVYTILGLEERDVITAGGGAILMAPGRREWIVLKRFVDEAPLTDLLPDINCALAWVQLKEFSRNEKSRKEIFGMYQHACLIGRHKLFARELDEGSTISSFAIILNSPFKDVKQFAAKKDIEIKLAFENSVISLMQEELSERCIHAKSLLLRTAHFPLYPRLTKNEVAKIVKVLNSLP